MTTRKDKIEATRLAKEKAATELAAITARVTSAKAELEELENQIGAARAEPVDIHDELSYARHMEEEESVCS